MPYGLNAGQIGLTFIPIAIGLCFTTLTIPWLKARYERLTEQRGGKLPEPEERLVLVMYGTWLIPISLFWYVSRGQICFLPGALESHARSPAREKQTDQ